MVLCVVSQSGSWLSQEYHCLLASVRSHESPFSPVTNGGGNLQWDKVNYTVNPLSQGQLTLSVKCTLQVQIFCSILQVNIGV